MEAEKMSAKGKIKILIAGLIISILAFMCYNMGPNLDYVIPTRLIRLSTMIVVAVSIAYSSVIFQTLTNNRILTPSIMGYEAVFILFQTCIVFTYGDKTFQVISDTTNFFISVVLMVVFSLFLYLIIFKRGRNNLFHLLLTGLVLGTLFETMSRFMQILIDPNEFTMIYTHLFASFDKMNTPLLLVSTIVLAVTLIIGGYYVKYLDILALGREQAINLGLDYHQLVRIFMIIISILVSVSTALVGPITFLGILVTNLTYQLLKTTKHSLTIIGCCILSSIVVISGQFITEHVFNFSTEISIIINFIGGIYFLYLILKSRRKV